jgi:hypothetical protein
MARVTLPTRQLPDVFSTLHFAVGHIALENPVPGSIDKRLPNQFIGQLRPEILSVP